MLTLPLNVLESPHIPSYRKPIGFSFGGPLVIPEVYNSSSKSRARFASYDSPRSRTGLDSFSTVATLGRARRRFF